MSASRIAPSVYTHDSRPEWGRGVVAEEQADRTTYVFENGGERTVMNEPSRLTAVELPPEEREALARSLLRARGPARPAAAPKKKRAAKAKAAKKKAPAEQPEG